MISIIDVTVGVIIYLAGYWTACILFAWSDVKKYKSRCITCNKVCPLRDGNYDEDTN